MWEWFITYGVWIIVALIAIVFLFPLRHRAERGIAKAMPKQWLKSVADTQKIAAWVIRVVGGVILAIVVAALISSHYGVQATPVLKVVGGWLLEHGTRILVIILLSYLAHRIAKIVVPRLVESWVKVRGKGRRARGELAKRSHTLSSFLTTAIGFLIIIAATFAILSEVGIDITPLLAGAGVAGIAIGFGAQSLIRDFLSGIFIILEDQYSKGDVVRIAGIAGLVEDVNLRRTVLRDLDGIVHIIPNGEVKVASNLTKEWSRAHLDIGVAYKEDLDRVMALMRKTWEEMKHDPDWGSFMLSETPWLLRVNEFGDSGITIKMVGETQPIKQWDVMGELRRRIKKVFDEEGIEIPWPHVKLYFGGQPQASALTCKACSSINPPNSKFCSNCGARLGS